MRKGDEYIREESELISAMKFRYLKRFPNPPSEKPDKSLRLVDPSGSTGSTFSSLAKLVGAVKVNHFTIKSNTYINV